MKNTTSRVRSALAHDANDTGLISKITLRVTTYTLGFGVGGVGLGWDAKTIVAISRSSSNSATVLCCHKLTSPGDRKTLDRYRSLGLCLDYVSLHLSMGSRTTGDDWIFKLFSLRLSLVPLSFGSDSQFVPRLNHSIPTISGGGDVDNND